MFFDCALKYDPASRTCDPFLNEDGDLALDFTPITPILLSVGLDRRADADDELPAGQTGFLTPASFSERRGGPCDALDHKGEPAGCKCWLLDRAKETEATRLLYQFWLTEGLNWVEPETGEPPGIDVYWLREGVLGYRIRVREDALILAIPLNEVN